MPLKRITVILTQVPGYDSIRVTRPLAWPGMKAALWEAGIAVDTMPQADVTLQALAGTDCVVFHGVAAPQIMNLLRRFPCRFAMFQDDLMKELPPWNPNVINAAQVRTLDYMLEECCAIVATTQPLAEALGYPEKTVVCGNLEDFDKLPDKLPGREKRALYAGGNSHAADLELLNGLEWDGETIILSSCLPSSKVAAHRNKFGVMSWRPNDKRWGHIDPTIDYERYQVWMNSLGMKCGIGLAPLVDCRFNQCKSILKVLEYARLGMFPMVSDVEPYSSLPDNICIKLPAINGGKSWSYALQCMSDQVNAGERAFDWGHAEHSYQLHWRRWVSAYSYIASKI